MSETEILLKTLEKENEVLKNSLAEKKQEITKYKDENRKLIEENKNMSEQLKSITEQLDSILYSRSYELIQKMKKIITK